MVTEAVIFDLGGTLVKYYTRQEFKDVLLDSIHSVQAYLEQEAGTGVDEKELEYRMQAENHEGPGHSVRRLEGRIARIFSLPASFIEKRSDQVARAFLKPIFNRASRYQDSIPVLKSISSTGTKVSIISNSPWGTPAYLWREELERQGLAGLVYNPTFCGDVGWRKPDSRIFMHSTESLGLRPESCIFVGDDFSADYEGSSKAGLRPILIDREGELKVNGESISSLSELLHII